MTEHEPHEPHETYKTWRDLLKHILSSPAERQRIAREINVSPVTLGRWLSGVTDPREHNLRLLLRAVPRGHQELLQKLLTQEFGDIFRKEDHLAMQFTMQDIPSVFYDRVLQAFTQLPQILRARTLLDLILQQTIEQVDPLRLGLAANVVRCSLPPPGQPVRSLRDSGGLGTPPWKYDLEQKTVFLGAESLCGTVVAQARPLAIQSPDESEILFPALWFDFEKSAAAAPIMRGGSDGIAGCLLVSSTQLHYFNEDRLALIERYANLLSLAFEPHEFVPLHQIQLHLLPSYKQQQPVLEQFRSRVVDLMAQLRSENRSIHLSEVQQLVWQQIEDELVALM